MSLWTTLSCFGQIAVSSLCQLIGLMICQDSKLAHKIIDNFIQGILIGFKDDIYQRMNCNLLKKQQSFPQQSMKGYSYCALIISQIQMSEIENESKREKTKEDYSRNVKKLKLKLATVQNEILTLERKVDNLSNTSNDKLISMKIGKFCKERRFTPQMLFRFADRTGARSISKLHFQETLAQLGLKLSKDEFLRLQYLIDQDLSGEISYSEYTGYLQAFGIRKEFSASDKLAKDVLQKLDIGKVLQIAQENGQDSRKRPSKHSNLLNYEEFIKYCHKHFPGLKNKELASIFNRLEKNQLINLQDLIDYLESEEAEKKRLEQKNKKKLKREDSKIRPIIGGQRTLKGIIEALLRCRLKESTIVFHSLQFLRLERIVGAKRGQLVLMFQQVDKKRRGSFTHNQLICYFIQKSEKSEDLPYAFELMAHKLALLKQAPDAVVGQYATQHHDFLTEQELKKFFEEQFGLSSHEYDITVKRIPRQQDGRYSVEKVVELLRRDGKRNQSIKPNSFQGRLIFRNARLALRCCLELQQKLAQLKQPRWNDYEFGPTEADQFGAESINMPMPSEQIDWLASNQIGMPEFFKEDFDAAYTCGSSCPNEVFTKTLYSLVANVPGLLWNSQKVDPAVRDIEEQHLSKLFTGIYPLAFHSFAKYGIYVIRLFIKEQWKYVVIDSKLPCAPDKTPFFSSVTGHRFSFMALIEKAYAKALGSYHAIYASSNPHQYIIELGNLLPVQYGLQKTMADPYKNLIWQSMVKFQKDEEKAVRQGKIKKARPTFAVMRSKNDEGAKEIPMHIPMKIERVVEVPDIKSKNSHKSHRLLLLRTTQQLEDESVWNKNWNRQEPSNKYSQMSLQVAEKLTEPALLKSKTIIMLNYKLFRSIFTISRPEPVNFTEMIILRKDLLFEEKFKCRYEVTAKSELEFLVVIAQRSLAPDARIIMEGKGLKDQSLWRESRREEMAVRTIRLAKGQGIILELSVQNWKSDFEYRYSLTFYMRHPRYQLKQRDRHMLFRYVSPYEEEPKMNFSEYENPEKQFIFRQFYRAAERRGCCG